MTTIITKQFQNFKVKTLLIDNEIHFIAKEISDILGYSETNKMLRRIDDEDKITISRNGRPNIPKEIFGNQGSIILLNESGLYNAIFGSKLAIAKQFKRWVTSEVLPEIRKTGSYSLQNSQSSKTQEVDSITKRAQLIRQSKELYDDFEHVFQKIGITEQKELAITTNRAVKNETEIDFIALSGKNGLEVEEKFFTVTELCELIRESENFSDEIKLSVSTKNNLKPQPINLNKILESYGFQVKIDKQWKPTQKGEKFSKFVQNKSMSSTKNIFHLNWKLEVLDKLF